MNELSNNRREQPRDALGFTLVELLVVIAIIAMLVSALMPAVQAARASARRAQCKSNLLQLVMAVQNYEMANARFPSGVRNDTGPIQSTAQGQHHSWVISLLPYLDEGTIARNIVASVSVYDDANAKVRRLSVSSLSCPSDSSQTNHPSSSYAACHHDVEAPIDEDNNGVFYLNSQITSDDIRDGLSQTLFLGEKRSDSDDLGWMSGTRATLRNTGTPINVDPWKAAIVANPPRRVFRDDYGSGYGASEGYEEEEGVGDEEDETLETELEPGDVEAELGGEELAEDAEELEEEEQKDRPAAKSNAGPAAPIKSVTSVGGFGSGHGGGAHLAFGDGRIQFMSSSMSGRVLQLLGHRNDGQLLDRDEYRE